MNGADTAWVSMATALVLLMTLPGLALFYGGLVRARNVLSLFMQCFALAAAMSLLWLLAGYSIAFGDVGEFLERQCFPAAFAVDACFFQDLGDLFLAHARVLQGVGKGLAALLQGRFDDLEEALFVD